MQRNWDGLSAAYKGRLERAGISKRDYNSGKSLAAARGHAQTPEHPVRAQQTHNRERYKEYRERRQKLEKEVEQKKERLFNLRNSQKDRSKRAIRKGSKSGREVSMRQMRQFIADDFDIDDIDWGDTDNEFLYYH
jgi:hypothetical protein